ncbi:MAG: FAD-dependent monooxygenase [Planktomarina sp.]|nr:FAD-dependent monooxygenase [Planktomarina sp.]
MTEIAISGAGIGGLVTALCLKNKGFNVTVFEGDTEIRALGVGINIMPHASKLLIQLGLGPQLDALGVQTRCIEYRTKFGHLIQSDPRSIEAGFEAPQYSIHRGELQAMLASEVEKQLGNSSIKLNKPVVGFRQGDNTVTILFKDGSEFNIDLLIDATGLHSKIRKQMNPNEGPLCYEGTMMFRGAVETDTIGDGKTMVIAGDHDVKFVTYPISEHARQSGYALTNWVAEVRHSEPRHINDADWGRGATLDFIKPFKDFVMHDMNLIEIMEKTEVVTEYPMVDRNPLSSWTKGNVALLGDAAHPMYPIGANGASQAILDAWSIAHCLSESPNPYGLKAYEIARLPATSKVVQSNREGGPEKVLDIAAARVTGPNDRIEDLISSNDLKQVATSYQKIAGFEKNMPQLTNKK